MLHCTIWHATVAGGPLLERRSRFAVDCRPLAALRLVQPNQRPGDAEVNALAQDLQDPDPANRLRAIKALASLGGAAGSAVAALEALLDDKDPDVRRAASEALGRLPPRP